VILEVRRPRVNLPTAIASVTSTGAIFDGRSVGLGFLDWCFGYYLAIGGRWVITHRVPLHGELPVRFLDFALVGVPLEPEDVVEVLASAAAPHLSRSSSFTLGGQTSIGRGCCCWFFVSSGSFVR